MGKKERRIVFAAGLVLLLIFTFTDLQISMAVSKKPGFAKVLEVVGEIPFTILTLAGCGMVIRFTGGDFAVKKLVGFIGGLILFVAFASMGGFMTWNYLNRNYGGISKIWILIISVLLAAVASWIAFKVPAEKKAVALRFAATALIYFLMVIIIMNFMKAMWGRMRFREMTDPAKEFTRWYQICGGGGFNDAYASFPSGHSMNSAGVILAILLPDIIPALKDKKNILRAIAYVWCIVVGASRVLMGAHFASDVTVGILLSFVLFEFIYVFVYRRRPIDE